MASPAMTGVVALALEAKPGLTIADLRSLLDKSAATPSGVSGLPNTDWGRGLVDAQALLQQLDKGAGATPGGEEDDDGCSCATGRRPSGGRVPPALALLALLGVAALRLIRR